MKLIERKDDEIIVMQVRYNHILELNKNAFQRIDKLEKKFNNEKMIIKEVKSDMPDLPDDELEYENEAEKENINQKNIIDERIKHFSSEEIKKIKSAIKCDSQISISSEKYNGKKLNVYTCSHCSVTIKDDKEILLHMTDNHRTHCFNNIKVNNKSISCMKNFYSTEQKNDHMENDIGHILNRK